MSPGRDLSGREIGLKIYESVRRVYSLVEGTDVPTALEVDSRHLREFSVGSVPAAPPLFGGRLYEDLSCLHGESDILVEMYHEHFVSEGVAGRREECDGADFSSELLALLNCVESSSLRSLADLAEVIRSVREAVYYTEVELFDATRGWEWRHVYAELCAFEEERSEERKRLSRALSSHMTGLSPDLFDDFADGYWRLERGLAMLRHTLDELIAMCDVNDLRKWLGALQRTSHLLHLSGLNASSLLVMTLDIALG